MSLKNLNMRHILFILCLGLIPTSYPQAQTLKTSLTEPEQSKVQAFLQETVQKLPPIIQSQLLKNKIEVVFKKFEKSYHGQMQGSKLILSEDILNTILEGSKEKLEKFKLIDGQKSATSHRTDFEFAQGTVLHELAHWYDSLNAPTSLHTISSQPAFLEAAYFPKIGLGITKRTRINFLESRSPDRYEWKNPQEAFAVNMEYFLLDPEFKCRRPGMYQTLSRLLNFNPSTMDCQNFTQDALITGNPIAGGISRWVTLQPQKLYQIHYLWAGKGDEIMSRFGHAMVRLVFCHPLRLTVGPECLNDISSHLVVSFRAAVNDTAINHLKGIKGDYPSIEFILPFTTVRTEYTKLEFRELFSLPLTLSETEKNQMLQEILESHWNYEGKYKFFVNNCADEIWSLLKRALPNRTELQKTEVDRPDALFKKLIHIGLGDQKAINNIQLAEKTGHYYPSQRKIYELVVAQFIAQKLISAAKNNTAILEQYLNKSASERRQVLTSIQKIPQSAKKLLGGFIILEELIELRQAAAVLSQGLATVSKELKKSSDLTPDEQVLAAKLNTAKEMILLFSAPAHLLPAETRYGWPTKTEYEALFQNPQLQQTAAEALNSEQLIKSQLSKYVSEDILTAWMQTKENIKIAMDFFKAL